ncbi:hypothetical protein U1Q18_040212 [Sarracenia purpurea var. burkii]
MDESEIENPKMKNETNDRRDRKTHQEDDESLVEGRRSDNVEGEKSRLRQGWSDVEKERRVPKSKRGKENTN